MHKGILTKIAGTLGLACVFTLQPPTLLAGTITWTIAENTFMAGGASVEGSFQYDADALSNNFSNVAITVGNDATPLFSADPVQGDSYTSANIVSGSDTLLDLLDSSTGTELQLYFQGEGLTDAGGTEAMGLHVLVNGNLADYEAGDHAYAASIEGTAPEPATTFMMLLGIAGVLVSKRCSSASPLRQLSRAKHNRKLPNVRDRVI